MAQAFGSITIVDITDIGELSVYPMSNLPLTTVFTPDNKTDTNSGFDPDWGVNNLTLSPVIYYAGSPLPVDNTKVTVTWTKKIGLTNTTLNTSTEVKQTNGNLVVSANQFSEVQLSPITYAVTVTYTDANATAGKTLTAEGQITFNVVKMATEERKFQITGNNIIKLNSSLTQIESASLKINTANVIFDGWYIGNTLKSTSSTLSINSSDTAFNGGTSLTITAKGHDKTNSSLVFTDDIIVFILKDGTPGDNNNMVLSNEDQYIPYDANNNTFFSTSFSLAYTNVQIYYGGEDVTKYYNITATPNNAYGLWTTSNTLPSQGSGLNTASTADGADGKKYWVVKWNSTDNENASVTFTATAKTGSTIPSYVKSGVSKTMSLTKIQTGADGKDAVQYSLELDSLVSNKNIQYNGYNNDGTPIISSTTYAPASVTLRGYKIEGNDKIATAYTFTATKDSNTESTTKTSLGTNGYAYTISGANSKIVFRMYDGSTLLDTQTLTITKDGAAGNKGDDGDSGESAYSLILGNYSDTISTTNAYKINANKVVEIPYSAYLGTSPTTCTVTSPTLTVNGTTLTGNTATAGTIKFTIPKDTVLGTSTNNSFSTTLNFTVGSGDKATNMTAIYTISFVPAGDNGTSPSFVQIATPNGYIFQDGQTTNLIAQVIASNVTVKKYDWQVYKNDGYTSINSLSSSEQSNYSGYTTQQLTIKPDAVNSSASYRCVLNDNNNLVAYVGILDKTDPVQVYLISSIGEQIINGNGVGYVYPRVVKNGVEVDTLDNVHISTSSKPSSVSGLTTGHFYYYLNSTTKQFDVYKATSATDLSPVLTKPTATSDYECFTGKYKWTYLDKNNQTITSITTGGTTYTLPAYGKIIYIDDKLINTKLILNCEVDY